MAEQKKCSNPLFTFFFEKYLQLVIALEHIANLEANLLWCFIASCFARGFHKDTYSTVYRFSLWQNTILVAQNNIGFRIEGLASENRSNCL